MGGIAGSGLSLGTLFIEIEAKVSEALKSLDKFGDETAKLIKNQEQQWAKLGQVGDKFSGIGKSLTLGVTVPLAAAGAAAIKFGTDLNSAMANVATLIPGNTQRVEDLKDSVQDLAVATGKSTTDIAGGLYQVISAFGDTADTVAILDTNARAATAGLATTEQAIALTSAVTKGYGDTTAEAVQKASDLAFTAVKLGQTTFPELAASIGRVVPLTKELGVSQEELFAVMATGSGVTGNASEVSTQLRGILQSLLAPTKEMTELLDKLGFSSGKLLIEQKGLHGAIATVMQVVDASGVPLQKFIGSIEGQTLALALTGSQADTYSQKLGAMQKAAGATDEAFKEQTQGINAAGFAMDQLAQRVAVMAQKFGDALAPALKDALDQLKPVVGMVESAVAWFTQLPDPVKRTAVEIAALGVALGPVLYFGGQFLSSLREWGPVLSSVAGAIAKFVSGSLIPLGVEIGVLGALFAVAAVVFVKSWEDAAKLVEPLWMSLEQDMLSLMKAARAVMDFFGRDVSGITQAIQAMEKDIAKLRSTTGGWADQMVKDLSPAAAKAGESVGKLMNVTAKSAAEQIAAGKTAGALAGNIGKLGEAHDKAGKAAKGQANAAKVLHAETEANEKAAKAWFLQMQKEIDALEDLKKKGREFEQTLKDIPLVETNEQFRKANEIIPLTAEHIAKLDQRLTELLGPLGQVKTAQTDAYDALNQFGIKSTSTYEQIAADAKIMYEKIRDYEQSTAFERDQARIKYLEAERQAAIARGEIWRKSHADEAAELDRLQGKYKTLAEDQKNAWEDMSREVSTIVTNFTQDIARSLFDGDTSWGEKVKSMLKSLGAAVLSTFIEPATKAIAKFVSETIADLLGGKGFGGLLDSLKQVGKAIADIFTANQQAVGAATGAPGAAGDIAGAGAGGAVGGAAVGGVAGAITGAIAAISSVISNFQLRGVNKSLDLIVNHTLRMFNELFNLRVDEWSRWGGWMLIKDDILNRMDRMLYDLDLAILKLDDIINADNRMYDAITSGFERMVGVTERAFTMNLYGTDPSLVASQIAQQMRLQGAAT